MSEQGAPNAERMRAEARCPRCEYSLRGLEGDPVTCPECGARVNVTALIAGTWKGPLLRAPLMNVVALPAAWAVGMLIVLLGALIGTAGWMDVPPPLAWAYLAIAAVGWILMFVLAVRRFGAREAIPLAILYHGPLLGYAIGGVVAAASAIALVLSARRRDLDEVPGALTALVVSIGVLWLLNRLERFIAIRCLRHHLRMRSIADDDSGSDP